MMAGIEEVWQLLVPIGGFAVLLAIISVFMFHQKHKKKKEPLFGSTIKTLPPNPQFYPGVPIQPDPGESFSDHKDLRVPAIFSEMHGKFGPSDSQECGLSSSHTRWSSMDKNSEHSDEEGSGPTWLLSFKLQFDGKSRNLNVTVFRAKRYPEKYSAGLKTTVYVTVSVLPADIIKQTSLYPNTGSPSFDEAFGFYVNPDDLSEKVVRLSLYELDHSRTRICLGHTIVKLSELPKEEERPLYFNKELENLSTAMEESCPEIHVSLSYNMQSEKMKIQLFAARHLPDIPGNNQFVLCTNVIVGTKVAKTKRTEPCNSLYGLFQCTYAFQIPAKHMDTCCLQFRVLQMSLESTDEEKVYGQIMIGPCMYTHGTGLEHWKQMLQNTKKTVEMWHKLH